MTKTQPTIGQLDKISYYARKLVTISLFFGALYSTLNGSVFYALFLFIIAVVSLFADTRGLYNEIQEDSKLFDKK